jgi:nitrogen-specific signal transduction histidine kinase/CheY-like chemotaxis protein
VFAPADRTVATAFASRAGIALENARLYHEVQQADRQKNEFLSMLAHELRNPLAPIRNANEVLRHLGSDPYRVRWAQGVIDRQLTQMVRLVDDLLDVSRLTLGKIRLVVEPLDLGAVVAQAVESVRPLVDQSGHQLEVDLPPQPVSVRGDRVRLAQVVTNLLNNAAKYTNPGGRITLTAAVRPNGAAESDSPAGEVEIRVRDTGIGISAEILPTVFDLFTQASRSLDRSQGGLGIGLTLVRRLIDLHGGSVEARSGGAGTGSEFVVRLPVASPDEERPPEPAAPARAPVSRAALRVMVIDDNVDGAESLAGLLRLLGHEARAAHDGPSGLDAVREFGPDVVLLDLGLPGMDGYEVGRRLQAEYGSKFVIAALSGYGREEDRKRSRESGFVAHFVKPIDLNQLRELLGTVHPPG